MRGYRFDRLGNLIHDTAIIGDSVVLGRKNMVGPYVVLTGKISIGDGNIFQSHCVIGSGPEHRLSWEDGTEKGLVIGDDNRFNEFVTVNTGYEGNTLIGDRCYLLRGSHVGHDAVLGNGVRVHCNVIVGGYCSIGSGVYLGLGSVLHPRVSVGRGALVGAQAMVTKDVGEGRKVVGVPAKDIGENG